MPGRAVSKRWAVDPDYEPPLTRLKARDDPNVKLPRVQDVPLPARTRQRRVLVIPSAPAAAGGGGGGPAAAGGGGGGGPGGGAAPLMQNAGGENRAKEAQDEIERKEISTAENLAEEMAMSGNEKAVDGSMQKEEITTNNQAEEVEATGKIQTEEVVMVGNDVEDMIAEDQMEESVEALTTECASRDLQQPLVNMIAENQRTTTAEDDGMQLEEMPGALDDLQIDDCDVVHARDQPTGSLVNQPEEATTTEGNRIDKQMPSTDDDVIAVHPWTEMDQRNIEREIREAAMKPEHERQYTWNLVVGIGSRSPMNPLAMDLGTEQGSNDHQPEANLIQGKASLATSDNNMAARPDSKETAAAAKKVGTGPNLHAAAAAAAQHDHQRPATAPVDWHEKSFSSLLLQNNAHHPLRLVQSANEHYHQGYRQNNDDNDDDNDDDDDDDDDAIEQRQQQQQHGQRHGQGQEQRQGQEQGQEQGQGQGQSSESTIIASLQRNAMQLRTEPVIAKPDILKDRNFVDNQRLSRDNLDLQIDNANHRISIVSYNIMAELEKEDLRPAGGEERAAGFSGGSRGGRRRDKRFGRAGASSSSLEDLVPGNYSERLLIELFYLDADILCLQSIAEGYWNKLERYLYNWGYSWLKMKRRAGQSSSSSSSSSNCCEAIFFRTKQFQLIKTQRFYLDDLIIQRSMHPDVTYHPGLLNSVEGREVVVMVTLCCRSTGQKFMVANTRCTPEYQCRPDLQAAQVCCIMQMLATLSAKPDGRRLPTIFCGNMDFRPIDGPYQVLCDGALSSATEQVFRDIQSIAVNDDQRCSLSSVDPVVFRHPMPALRSAYATVLGSDPPNVWKRNSATFDCGSYVWFDESELSVVGVLDHVTSKAVTCSEGGGQGGIPNEFFPSSNLSLKATFQFRGDGGLQGTGGRQVV